MAAAGQAGLNIQEVELAAEAAARMGADGRRLHNQVWGMHLAQQLQRQDSCR